MNVSVTIADDVATALLPVKGSLGFYIGGMGARSRNFHMELMARMGFEEEAHHIQDLFFEGKREEAVMAVPDAFADEISLVGPPGRIKERLAAWRRHARHHDPRRQPRPRGAAAHGRPHHVSRP